LNNPFHDAESAAALQKALLEPVALLTGVQSVHFFKKHMLSITVHRIVNL
jgi:hypothetical protein